MNITRDQAKTITAEINAAIDQILANHGLNKDKVSTKYGDLYKITIEASIHQNSENGVNLSSREMDDLRYYARFHGITDIDTDITQIITVNGVDYAPAGYKPRATKRPFLMKSMQDGKTYIFPDTVARYFPSYDGKPSTARSYSRTDNPSTLTYTDANGATIESITV